MLIFKFQKVFSPPVIFSNAEREGTGITVLKCRIWISYGVILIITLVVTCFYLLLQLSIIYLPYFDNMLTNRQTDWHRQSRVYFCFKTCIDNQYTLHWTPNAYRNMLMRIFTPSLYFQCVFNDFQCVITLLRALSVALPCHRLVGVFNVGPDMGLPNYSPSWDQIHLLCSIRVWTSYNLSSGWRRKGSLVKCREEGYPYMFITQQCQE